jgi:hypothetical protein
MKLKACAETNGLAVTKRLQSSVHMNHVGVLSLLGSCNTRMRVQASAELAQAVLLLIIQQVV